MRKEEKETTKQTIGARRYRWNSRKYTNWSKGCDKNSGIKFRKDHSPCLEEINGVLDYSWERNVNRIPSSGYQRQAKGGQ